MQMQGPPVYARSASQGGAASHHSRYSVDGDDRDKYEGPTYLAGGGPGGVVGPIDEQTEREYERRYAREKRELRALESRPTLGGSLMSFMGKLGRTFGGSERR